MLKTLATSSVCLAILVAAVGLGGCVDPYYANGYGYYGPGYGYGGYGYGGYGYGGYGSGYGYRGYGYGHGPTYVSVAVEDRPYYLHGAEYRTGGHYYAWRSGYWGHVHGHRAWVHGHYVRRG